MNNVSLLLSGATVSPVSRLFRYEEENPTGPAFCCSLRSGVCMKGRVRGRERGRERERERERERGSFLLRCYVCDASEQAPPTPRRSQSPRS